MGAFKAFLVSLATRIAEACIFESLSQSVWCGKRALSGVDGSPTPTDSIFVPRLESAPTAKYSRGLVVFIAFFVCKHGGPAVVDSIDGLQPQPPLSAMILDRVWAPTLPQVLQQGHMKPICS